MPFYILCCFLLDSVMLLCYVFGIPLFTSLPYLKKTYSEYLMVVMLETITSIDTESLEMSTELTTHNCVNISHVHVIEYELATM